MVQLKVSHAFMTQAHLGVPLNRGRRFLSITTDFQALSNQPLRCLKRLTTLLRPVKEINTSVLSPFIRNCLISFSGSLTNIINQEPWNHSARDMSIQERKGLQEPRASTTEAAEEKELKYLTSDYGWRVRLLTQEKEEMDVVADIQSAAFYNPAPFWDSFFYMIFKAEVLAALLYKLRNSPPNRTGPLFFPSFSRGSVISAVSTLSSLRHEFERPHDVHQVYNPTNLKLDLYACLVAETGYDTMEHGMADETKHKIVGVVDVTAYTDKDILYHLGGAEEYLYVSGIAVGANYRRRKVATVLLKACDFMAFLWGFEYLVLRAYKDDAAARTLYSRAGYEVVFQDPPWTSVWIGRKQRVLMVKRTSNDKLQ